MDDKPYVQLGHGRAYSGRDGVNVIMWTPNNHDGNHFYPRARGRVLTYIKACIESLIAERRASGERLWPAYPNPRVTVREEYGNPGEYHWTVWDE